MLVFVTVLLWQVALDYGRLAQLAGEFQCSRFQSRHSQLEFSAVKGFTLNLDHKSAAASQLGDCTVLVGGIDLTIKKTTCIVHLTSLCLGY